MNPSKRQFILYLEDILMSIEKIQDYIYGLEYIEFKEKSIAQDAKMCMPQKKRVQMPMELTSEHRFLIFCSWYAFINL